MKKQKLKKPTLFMSYSLIIVGGALFTYLYIYKVTHPLLSDLAIFFEHPVKSIIMVIAIVSGVFGVNLVSFSNKKKGVE